MSKCFGPSFLPYSFLPCSERPSGWPKVWKQVLSGSRSPFHLQSRLPAGWAQQCGVSSQRHLDGGATPLQRYGPSFPGACWMGGVIPGDAFSLTSQRRAAASLSDDSLPAWPGLASISRIPCQTLSAISSCFT